MPVGIALGTAAIGAGASIYGAASAAKSSRNALKAQMAQVDRTWGAVNPWLTAGSSALGQISDPTKVLGNFQASPDFNFRKSQALDAVTQSKAVSGLLRSGSALNAVTQRAGDLASAEFGNWWNRQSGLSTQGLTAANIGAGTLNAASNAIGTNGANQGNAGIATGNALGDLGGSLMDILGKYGGSSTGGTSSYANSTAYSHAPPE